MILRIQNQTISVLQRDHLCYRLENFVPFVAALGLIVVQDVGCACVV